MGGYLAKPVTQAAKEYGVANSGLAYGSASMQGWRPKMEDAHVVLFDMTHENRESEVEVMIGLFDGHGGREVAQYCANHLQDAVSAMSMYKNGEDLGHCLREALMRLDCSLLTKIGKRELKQLRTLDDHVICVHKELFPLLGSHCGQSRKQTKPTPPTENNPAMGAEEPSRPQAHRLLRRDDSGSDHDGSCSVASSETDATSLSFSDDSEAQVSVQKRSACPLNSEPQAKRKRARHHVETPNKNSNRRYQSNQLRRQGRRKRKSESESGYVNTSHPIWEKILHIGMERGIAMQTGDVSHTISNSTSRSGVGLEILPRSKASEHLSDPNMVCIDKSELSPTRPGYESGSTALVACIEATSNPDVKRLLVVNAGDSRCVLSRGGLAAPMSTDHSPHLPSEETRITMAGGSISEEGRIGGLLNLSRAIGDHQFKQDRSRPLKSQIVTSWADVESTLLRRGVDDFIVLACDGIWDAMSSQEVVDFCAVRIATGMSFPKIAESLCQVCLAKDPEVDPGTDNMTAIICQPFP